MKDVKSRTKTILLMNMPTWRVITYVDRNNKTVILKFWQSKIISNMLLMTEPIEERCLKVFAKQVSKICNKV